MNEPPSGSITFSSVGVMVASVAAGFCSDWRDRVSDVCTDGSFSYSCRSRGNTEGKTPGRVFVHTIRLRWIQSPLVSWRGSWSERFPCCCLLWPAVESEKCLCRRLFEVLAFYIRSCAAVIPHRPSAMTERVRHADVTSADRETWIQSQPEVLKTEGICQFKRSVGRLTTIIHARLDLSGTGRTWHRFLTLQRSDWSAVLAPGWQLWLRVSWSVLVEMSLFK